MSVSQSDSVMVIRIAPKPLLRDITRDLRDRMEIANNRVKAVQARYTQQREALELEFRKDLAAAKEQYDAAKALLDLEEKRRPNIPDAPATPAKSLGDFLIEEVNRGSPKSKEVLRTAAQNAGYFAVGETGGRVMHTTLLNMVRAGRLLEESPGIYRASRLSPASATKKQERL